MTTRRSRPARGEATGRPTRRTAKTTLTAIIARPCRHTENARRERELAHLDRLVRERPYGKGWSW